MSDRKIVPLRDIADILTGFPFKGDEYESSGDLKVVRGENVTIGSLRWDTPKYWNKSTLGLEKYFLREGDFVIGMDGSRVGKNRSVIKGSELPLILAQRVARLRAKEGVCQGYLNSILLSQKFPEYVEAIHTGTSIPHISQSQIGDFEVEISDDYTVQEAIAEVITRLDKKVDLLQRNNKTLEQIAEILFKQWFVENEDDSWEDSKLEDYCLKIAAGGTPSTKVEAYYDGGINWYSTKELKDCYLLESMTKISEAGLENSSAKLFPAGTVLIAIYAAPTVGRLGILASPASFNQAACGLVPNDTKCCKEFLYLYLKSQRIELNSLASGSAQQNLNVSKIRYYPVKMIPGELMMTFKALVQPLFKKIELNSASIEKTEALREALLPQLISGAIQVVK